MENPGGHLGPSLVDSSQLLNGGLALFGMILLLGLLCSYPPPHPAFPPKPEGCLLKLRNNKRQGLQALLFSVSVLIQ